MEQASRTKGAKPLPPDLRAALQRRVDASSVRAVGRDLRIAGATITRGLAGEGLTPAYHRLLEMLLSPSARETQPSRNPQPAAHCVA